MATVELDLETLRHIERIVIARPPEDLYAMVTDVRRFGEWSPECTGGEWQDRSGPPAEGPQVGAWFIGRNRRGDKTWENRCEVVAADPGREFTWVVWGARAGLARWGYTFTPVTGGTEVAEHWELLPAILDVLDEMPEQERTDKIGRFVESSRTTPLGMAATLAALKRIAESE